MRLYFNHSCTFVSKTEMLNVFFPLRRTHGVAFSVNDEEKLRSTCDFLNSALILLGNKKMYLRPFLLQRNLQHIYAMCKSGKHGLRFIPRMFLFSFISCKFLWRVSKKNLRDHFIYEYSR
jgi:hypothetical protein